MKKSIVLLSLIAVTPLLAADLDFSEARQIVIQFGGRKKPLDTYAAESLQAISGRRAFTQPDTGQRVEAMDFLCSIWFGTRDWRKTPVILVSNAALRQQLGLAPTQRFFSFDSLMASDALAENYQALQAKRARKEEISAIDKGVDTIVSRIEQLSQLANPEAMSIVPNSTDSKAAWLSAATAVKLGSRSTASPIAAALRRMAEAYRTRDAGTFHGASSDLRRTLASLAPGQYPKPAAIEREVRYNHLHLFRWAWLLYLAALIGLLFPRGGRAGAGLFLAGILVHVYGFVLRCQIAGYAPVTNMYESVVWVSLGVAAFALIFSLVHKARVYLLTAAPIAIAGLILADMLPSVLNSSIGPLPPVLRDNFWLATHVLTITLGYAAFALAMGLGHVILAGSVFKRTPLNENSAYHHLLHRVLQAGVLLLAIGTILGGVWANYAWGRFWGWDPKETWALIALLLYIFALHGRLAGWWRNFGLSVAAVVCFNGVLMAWYGVNFVLGKGLHSYGFGGGGLQWIGSLVGLDLVFVAFCVAAQARRTGWWRGSSHRNPSFTSAEPARQ